MRSAHRTVRQSHHDDFMCVDPHSFVQNSHQRCVAPCLRFSSRFHHVPPAAGDFATDVQYQRNTSCVSAPLPRHVHTFSDAILLGISRSCAIFSAVHSPTALFVETVCVESGLLFCCLFMTTMGWTLRLILSERRKFQDFHEDVGSSLHDQTAQCGQQLHLGRLMRRCLAFSSNPCRIPRECEGGLTQGVLQWVCRSCGSSTSMQDISALPAVSCLQCSSSASIIFDTPIGRVVRFHLTMNRRLTGSRTVLFRGSHHSTVGDVVTPLLLVLALSLGSSVL